jgi:hypothetical protein
MDNAKYANSTQESKVMEHAELTFAQLCKTYSKMEHAS